MSSTARPTGSPSADSIIIGNDSLPPARTADAASAVAYVQPAPPNRQAGDVYKQMFRIVDDLHTVVEERNAAMRAVRRAHRRAIRRLILIASRREAGGAAHCLRVGAISAVIAQALGQPVAWCNMIFDAAAVHDLGNISIPDAILYKTGRLTEREWVIVRDHPLVGANILGSSTSPLESLAAEIALNHHERWDGGGYPAQRKGTNIPLAARIVSVADFVDSLCSSSDYREVLAEDQVFELLELSSGSHFEPAVVQAMQAQRPQLARIRERAAECAAKLGTDIDYPPWWQVA